MKQIYGNVWLEQPKTKRKNIVIKLLKRLFRRK